MTGTTRRQRAAALVVAVQHLGVRREGVQRFLNEALAHVRHLAHGNHRGDDLVAAVVRLLGLARAVRNRSAGVRQLGSLGLQRHVHRLAVASELRALVSLEVTRACGDEGGVDHLDERGRLDLNLDRVDLELDRLPCLHLLWQVDAVLLKHGLVLLRGEDVERLDGGVEVEQAALLDGHLRPFGVVAVAREDRRQGLLEELRGRIADRHAALHQVGPHGVGLGERSVDHHVGVRDVVRAADGAELEAVAARREGRGAVAILGVHQDLLAVVAAVLERLAVAVVALERPALHDRLHVRLHAHAGVERHDGRRGLLRAEAVVVARADARHPHHVAVLEEGVGEAGGGDGVAALVLRLRPSLHQVDRAAAGRGEDALHRPVVVLAVAVDPRERLLVEEHAQPVLVRELVHNLHAHHVLVSRKVGHLEDGRELVLAGRHLVVVHDHRAADEPELLLHRAQVGVHRVGDLPEVVEVRLLPACRRRADQRAAAVQQVRPLHVRLLRDDEELLLPADVRHALRDVLLAEVGKQALALRVDRRHRAQQRRLLVESHPIPRDEARRDVHRLAAHERRRLHVPRVEGGGGVRLAQATVGERRAVGLRHEELGAVEVLLHRPAERRRREVKVDEAVVLLGARATHRGEPVGEVDGTTLDGPVHHRLGDLVLRLLLERRAREARLLEGREGSGRSLAQLVVRVQIRAEERRGQRVAHLLGRLNLGG
mmetsp:Transcript_1728/g.4402  ORF Transcript_1728/g.4402 Transcript_1728/m.4402 type:complete len:714 (+) Transcript_1728:130-2271(+)